ncbi:MAG TPA: long-chain fatty acid--CoA ligase, partial [Turneriella sp.]|nr:long-chain fatty acid--CoA ligase [Turneriella sp.]
MNGQTDATDTKNIFENVWDSLKAGFTALTLKLPDLYMDSIFLTRIRAMLGGQLRGTISGGGALPLHIDEFYNAI